MNISAPFIKRPVATSLLDGSGAMAGAIAYTLLPVAPLPEVDFPTMQVNAGLPGRESGNHGFVGSDASRAAVQPNRRRHRNDVEQRARVVQISLCSST